MRITVLLFALLSLSTQGAAIGEQRLLIIPTNFTSNTTEQYTLDQIRAQALTAPDLWYQDPNVSAGQTRLTGDVAPWVTIEHDPAVCDIDTVALQAKAKAVELGYDLAAYTHLIYLAPSLQCGWAGLSMEPGRIYLTTIETRVVIHELGHNFGLGHSKGLVCPGADSRSPSCVVYEFGDYFDIMGNGSALFNPSQMRRLGYLEPQLIAANGEYTIGVYAGTHSLPRALRIPAGIDPVSGKARYLYVALRQPIGKDISIKYAAGYDSLRMNRGVVINIGWEGTTRVWLLDTTPGTRLGQADLNDAPVLMGESFVDPLSGTIISPVSVVDGSAVVSVTLGPNSTPNSPPVALDDSASTAKNVAVSIPVLANDSDPDGQSVSVVSAVDGSLGKVTVNANGTVTYKPNKNALGTDHFTYTITDGQLTDTASVTVTINRR